MEVLCLSRENPEVYYVLVLESAITNEGKTKILTCIYMKRSTSSIFYQKVYLLSWGKNKKVRDVKEFHQFNLKNTAKQILWSHFFQNTLNSFFLYVLQFLCVNNIKHNKVVNIYNLLEKKYLIVITQLN